MTGWNVKIVAWLKERFAKHNGDRSKYVNGSHFLMSHTGFLFHIYQRTKWTFRGRKTKIFCVSIKSSWQKARIRCRGVVHTFHHLHLEMHRHTPPHWRLEVVKLCVHKYQHRFTFPGLLSQTKNKSFRKHLMGGLFSQVFPNIQKSHDTYLCGDHHNFQYLHPELPG